ncbi:MAG: hypothetical protein J7K46_03955 [Bacteroidales bacterium]|nr:hypothetical protein [Bacteroidales bacterium]
MKKFRDHTEDTNILIFTSRHEIYFTASSVIKQGLLTIQNMDETIIFQKMLSNTNHEHVVISEDIEIVSIKILSDEINYEKILRLYF